MGPHEPDGISKVSDSLRAYSFRNRGLILFSRIYLVSDKSCLQLLVTRSLSGSLVHPYMESRIVLQSRFKDEMPMRSCRIMQDSDLLSNSGNFTFLPGYAVVERATCHVTVGLSGPWLFPSHMMGIKRAPIRKQSVVSSRFVLSISARRLLPFILSRQENAD